MTSPKNHYPTAEQMYRPGVPHYKLELIAHVHRSQLRYSTPAEYGSLGRTGAPRWTGTMAVTPDGLGAAFAPALDERLMNGGGFTAVQARIRSEGVPVDLAD